MGRDKAFVEIGDVPMVRHVANALHTVTDDIIVVGKPGPVLDLPTLPDAGPPHRGPLAGVVAALRHVGGPIVVVAVDQPFLERAVLEALISRFDGSRPVVPVDEGILQVTCAAYPVGFLDGAERQLAAGGSLRRAVRHSSHDAWSDWPGDGRSWFSLDTPKRVDEAILRFGHPPM